jgi:hypothetical protein
MLKSVLSPHRPPARSPSPASAPNQLASAHASAHASEADSNCNPDTSSATQAQTLHDLTNQVIKLRSDHALASTGPTPEFLAALLHRASPRAVHAVDGDARADAIRAVNHVPQGVDANPYRGKRDESMRMPQRATWRSTRQGVTAWVAPFQHVRGSYGCYRESDWMAVVSRDRAEVYFNQSSTTSCEWQSCFVERYRAVGLHHCAYNELLLLDWLIFHGLQVGCRWVELG